ncbi:hypothetical protein [Sorangium sp. So ce176]|uniref:hypothetical protein n=1 Tax=Sorangium sp. So ce176 TaxID=3133286 RepID=UPI003F646B0F
MARLQAFDRPEQVARLDRGVEVRFAAPRCARVARRPRRAGGVTRIRVVSAG